MLTWNCSVCPTGFPFCLVRRFIHRTNRGRADGCYDTVIFFHGSLSSSLALICCLLAACWSFPCNTHTPVKARVSHLDTDGIYKLFQLLSAGTRAAVSIQQLDAWLCVSVRVYFKHTDLNMQGQLLLLSSYTKRLGCNLLHLMRKISGQMLFIYFPAGDSSDLW